MAICVSDQDFQQISFVNGIATANGGTHVDYVVDMVVKILDDGTNHVLADQIKNHMWIFVSCYIDNPTFDSQSNEMLTLEAKSFGSECVLSEKFKKGIIESVLLLRLRLSLKSRMEKRLEENQEGKAPKLSGIPDLDDAKEAGTKRGVGCTLILAEGKSAKAFVVGGLSVLGKDFYGVYPLKGKLLNVREATPNQMKGDRQISDLVKILGLQFEKKYESMNDLRTLRYGKVLMVTDKDEDGFHLKGLVINFIHFNWPGLLKLSFLGELIFPIIKESIIYMSANISHGSNIHCQVIKDRQSFGFNSEPEFERWKKATDGSADWKVKYYKGQSSNPFGNMFFSMK